MARDASLTVVILDNDEAEGLAELLNDPRGVMVDYPVLYKLAYLMTDVLTGGALD